MRRGQLWWAQFDDIGPHAVVLLSRDATYRVRRQATVALVTSRIRGIPVEVLIGEAEGLAYEPAINVDNLATIDLSVLTRQIGTLSPAKLHALDSALHFALGLSY